VLIELGEDRTEPVPERRPPHRAPRWPVALGLVLALLLGGAAAPRPGLVPLYRVPYRIASSFALGPDTVYVTTGTRVSAYDLRTGTHRWDATAPFPPQSLVPVGDVVLGVVSPNPDDPQLGTVAFDAGTGRLLWRQQATVADVAAGTAILETVGSEGPLGVHGVDLRTGRTVWTGPGVPGAWPVYDLLESVGQDSRMVFWVPDTAGGTTEVVDEATGRVLSRARLPIGPVGGSSSLTIADGLLVVAQPEGSGTRVTTYALDTLAQRWQTLVSATGYGGLPCGPVLCLFGYNQLTGLDPATGAVRWQTAEWIDAQPLPGERLLLSSARQGSDRLVADATTLRPVTTLTPWEAVGGQAPPPLLLSRDTPSLRTWFAELPTGTTTPLVLGSVPPVQRPQCAAAAGYLACPTVHNELQVWRYRLSAPP
jgi:outer membrane protein assembly factor BamB